MSKTIDLDAAIAAIMSEPSEVRYPAYYAEKLKRLSAVPQEMSAREFFEITKRRAIAEKRNAEIIFTPSMLTLGDFDAWIADAEQWAADHPEKRKTYAEDFKEHFGHSWNNKDNNLQCRGKLYNDNADCVNSPRCDCEACWNEEMEEQDE